MHYRIQLKRPWSLFILIVFFLSVAPMAWSSGSYAPPKARGINSAKVELYHLGKRLALKRIAPKTDTKLSEEQHKAQVSRLEALRSQIQAKHLKNVEFKHLKHLNAQEFEALIVYLTTRYGVSEK